MKQEYICPYTGTKTISYRDENGFYHRTDGSAHIIIHISDQPYEAWYIHGALHREDGPAEFIGNSEHWYLNDVYYDPEDMPMKLFMTYCNWEYKKKNKL